MIPDNYSMFEKHDAEQHKMLQELPVCEYCRNEIQDDFYFEINDEAICEECLKEHFRKAVGDYVS